MLKWGLKIGRAWVRRRRRRGRRGGERHREPLRGENGAGKTTIFRDGAFLTDWFSGAVSAAQDGICHGNGFSVWIFGAAL